MFKWIFTWIVAMTTTFGFTEDAQEHVYAPGAENEVFSNPNLQALGLLAQGNAYLLNDDPVKALEFFQAANFALDPTDPDAIPIRFLLNFGEIITYDCLGRDDLCRQSIGSLFLLINEDDDEDEDYFDDDDDFSDTVLLQILRALAQKAPSYEVRELLFCLMEDIAEELMPTFGPST